MRGTFANVRIKNLMLPPQRRRLARGRRRHGHCSPTANEMSIYDAAMKYIAAGTPTVIFAGEEYGTGSSRDWAAKGTQLLGVKAVVARSFERIHRINLVGMGVLPCSSRAATAWRSLGIKGDEKFDVVGSTTSIRPQMDVTLVDPSHGRHARGSAGAAAHRHADRGRLLPARRHPAVRAARVACRIIGHRGAAFIFDTRARNPSSRPPVSGHAAPHV